MNAITFPDSTHGAYNNLPEGVRSCGHCGALCNNNEKFCVCCGHDLPHQVHCSSTRHCDECGSGIGHKIAFFCPECGHRLKRM